MVVITYQYPQYLYAFKTAESTQGPNGSWTEEAATWELKAACREETNGKGSEIQTADGTALIFASLIQIPKGTKRINEGTEVIVTREEVPVLELLDNDFIEAGIASGLIVARGVCQKYDYGRLHCRMWI